MNLRNYLKRGGGCHVKKGGSHKVSHVIITSRVISYYGMVGMEKKNIYKLPL